MGRLAWGRLRLVLSVLVAVATLGGASWALAGAASAAGSLTATFVKTSDWGSGYVADYDIANGAAAITDWTLSFDLPAGQSLTNSWDGNVTQSGSHVVVTDAGWNGSLATGGTAQFGFQASYGGTFSPPSNCQINGQPCDGSGGSGSTTTTMPPTTTTTTTMAPTTTTSTTTTTTTTTTAPPTTTTGPPGGALTATFTKTSDWGDGFVADYTIANSGPPVSSWTLRFSLPASTTITSAWSGNLTQSGTSYTITNASWNGDLATGGAATVGFQASYTGAFSAPTDCTINGLSCSGSGSGGTGSGSGSGGGTGSGSGSGGSGSGGSGSGGSGSNPLPPSPAGAAFPFAPYVDATVDYPPFDLASDQQASGTTYFTLAFIVSQDGCQASWGGYYPTTSQYYQPQIQALRAAGGDVSISFGGEAGTELADACTSASALEAQYQSVVSEYDVSHIDFDIEGADETDTTSLVRRFQAVAELEAADPNLSVSLTLPVLPTGLDANGLHVVKTAIAEGVRVDLVNVMTMDYGDGAAPDPAGQMGAYAISAVQATHTQLQALYPALTSAQVWQMVGATPMLGVNDVSDEIFGLSDAQQLEAFAAQVHLGRLSMWAATRDVACPGGAQRYASDTCSGIVQQPLAFSTTFAAYQG